MEIKEGLKERFDEKWIEKDATDEIEDECWMWQSAKQNGYGAIMVHNKKRRAHRISVMLYKDKKPGDDWVLHRCHQKLCVRPSHLYIGTPKENTQDALERGTFTQIAGNGEDNHQTKLNKEEVKEIRRKYDEQDATYFDLAEEYGVAYGHIGRIVRRERWEWLD